MKTSKLSAVISALVFCCSASLAQAVEMVLTSEVAATHWKVAYMNEFAQKVGERSKGEIDVKVYPAGQLFSDQDAVGALGTGAVHMVWPVSVRLETIVPSLGFINLPFSLTDEAMSQPCYADKLTQLISGELEARNLVMLNLLRTSDLFFVFQNIDAQKLDDLHGKKLRVTGGRVFLDMIRGLGASPVSMAASEMSTALSQGAIDGIYTSPAGWAEMIGISAKYAYHIPNFSLATYAILVDKSWLESLTPAQQTVIREVTQEIAQRQWAEAQEQDAVLIKRMQDKGALFRLASEQDMAKAHELAERGAAPFKKKHADIIQRAGAIAQECGV